MRIFNWLGCLMAVGVAGCSHYPIPDDVSPLKTEEIVQYARCEMEVAIRDYMLEQNMITTTSPKNEIKNSIKAAKDKEKNRTPLEPREEKLLRLAKVAVAYTFDFNITEHSTTGAGVGFRLPWSTNALDAGATATLDLTRQGSRVFGAEDKWEDLIIEHDMCDGHSPQQTPNIIYPLTGSIGVGRVVKTFIKIDDLGGAKDSFVDILTFTTMANGGINAGVRLEPTLNQFRVVSATAAASASRLDIHKLTISLVFPRPYAPNPNSGVIRVDGDLNAPFTRPAEWRARYNLCVADARAKEAAFKLLRLEAPEVYCITYADRFAPLSRLRAERSQNSSTMKRQSAKKTSSGYPSFIKDYVPVRAPVRLRDRALESQEGLRPDTE